MHNKRPHPGLYVALEGIDGSGKSSVIGRLMLMQFSCPRNPEMKIYPETTRMPGGTVFSEKYRHACLNENVSPTVQTLFYSALNVDASQKFVAPHLKKGDIVIADRGFGSTYCYQGLAVDNEQMVEDIVRNAKGVPFPDLTIYLSIDIDTAILREHGQNRSEDRYGKSSRLNKECIKEAYDLLYLKSRSTSHLEMPQGRMNGVDDMRSLLTGAIAIVDASRSIQEVTMSCHKAIEQHLSANAPSPQSEGAWVYA